MKLNYYKKKSIALEKLESNNILCNRGITNYFITNDYITFLNTIKKSKIKDYYEYIPKDKAVCFFFDIEIYKDESEFFEEYESILEKCYTSVATILGTSYNIKKIILESHSESNRSFHIILRIIDEENNELMFKDVNDLKSIYKLCKLDELRDNQNRNLIDPSVYREGLFRTIYSSKTGENRPLIKSKYSDDFEDIETFVCYKKGDTKIYENVEIIEIQPVPLVVNAPEELNNNDKKTIMKFIQKDFHHYPNKIRDIFIDKTHNCIVVALIERYCPFVEREHTSNNQYIVIDISGAKQKCHDVDCNNNKYNELKLENYPKEVNEIIKKCLKVNQQELELIDHTIIECKNYINENFDKNIKEVSFDRNEMIFRGNVCDKNLIGILKGTCPECNVEHQISDNGYCLKCKVCNSIFPKKQLIPVDERYTNLNNFWMNYNQLINNGTINNNINNIIHIYNGTDIEFSCDIKLDNAIFKSKEVTSIMNQILDGHKITMISRLLFTINKNFVYSRTNWYYFTGSIWKSDSDNIEMKKEIMDLSKLFVRIKTFYDNKSQTDENTIITLNKNIKSLINKFHKPSFQDDIIKGAKIYNNDERFVNNLNSKKHLVPFTNGVYDLLEKKFRKTKKEDFINLTMNYDYNANASNKEVYTFLEQILPNKNIREYVLKKMSECLNGDIPNTYFLMFIGDTGANGKSQLLNLMKLTMGDFGEKVEVTLLTRKRNNANEANTEKIKLMHKRYAFLSEPEDGEKINIGLLKELTGSEEIVARGLYQESVSFVMEAKLFLACNELPEIKGEDTALWRRIRVIDFPSRFVEDPKEENEYKIDRTLPSRMREDLTWRQTFVNILIDYYYKSILEPVEVQVKTNEYRQENNNFYNWLEENIEYKQSAILQLSDVCNVFIGKKVGPRAMTKYKKEIEKYIKEKYKHLDYEYQKIDQNHRGWKDLAIKNY
jgi:P4 family phage/plasmid primase-like protien